MTKQIYMNMLSAVRMRKAEIEEVSLEVDSFNEEWNELVTMEGILLKLVKIIDRRQNSWG